MNLTKNDFAKLRTSLIFAVIMVAAGVGSIYWMIAQTQAGKVQLAIAKSRLSGAEQKLRQASSEEAELKSKAEMFKALEARNIIGLESRLDWVELISRIRNHRRLFEIDYEFTPQADLGLPVGGYQFASSTMQFWLPLLHEGDLNVFLADLKREAPAIIQPRNCVIEQMNDKSPSGANLRATCTVEWITLSNVASQGGSS